MSRRRFVAATLALGTLAGLLVLALALGTLSAIEPAAELPTAASAGTERERLLDRHGEPIALTYGNLWNAHDVVELHAVPALLREAFVEAEDRRFFEHAGVDWRARLHALVQNLRAGRAVRGASTITEQVSRMLRPRPRTAWSRWVEGFEAAAVEKRYTKGEILEFYLNQVPYARQRRGVVQAARDYFDRDLDTLSAREMLALAVLVRSPSRLDLRRGSAAHDAVGAAIDRLARRMHARGLLSDVEFGRIAARPLELRDSRLQVRAPHFVRHVRNDRDPGSSGRVRTTLDGSLQRRVEAVLEQRLEALAGRDVTDGAVLVVDHRRNEVLAWVNAGGFSTEREASQIDAILTPRQPGSTLKPFLYALALEQGWTAATLIEDTPFAGSVGSGLHPFRNYSRLYHGTLRLRDALGNSLNVPAVRTVRAVGPAGFHQLLRELGFDSLNRHPDVYGEGLALGNGEVSLHELVGAYATLARNGVRAPLRNVIDDTEPGKRARRILDEEIASILADILSDPDARRLEFGAGSVLELPAQTAVKTGTSSDYRDAWAVGFSDRHTVGVWMGNPDRREMNGVSGSIGPALVLRATFAELRRGTVSRPLSISRKLQRTTICRQSGRLATSSCPAMEEWFRGEQRPETICPIHGAVVAEPGSPAVRDRSEREFARLIKPTPDLHLAMDPRIPDEIEAFAFEVESSSPARRVEWFVDGAPIATTADPRFDWKLSRGDHTAHARVWGAAATEPIETPRVSFRVK